MPSSHRYLWLLRHAKTAADPPKGGTDFDRTLTPRGRRDAVALAELIGPDGAGLGLPEEGPAPRAGAGLPGGPHHRHGRPRAGRTGRAAGQELVPDFYGAEPDDVLEHLRTLTDDLRSVMVVGHNPTAHALASGLIGTADKKGRELVARRGFPTCALGIYRFTIDHWTEMAGGTARLTGLFTPPFGS